MACGSEYAALPPEVVEESKRLVLDSLGCAVGATDSPKGRIGIALGQLIGGSADDATVIGTGKRYNVFGAAFANGELINALDFDAVLPPGHVVPYVPPGALAIAESQNSSGRDLISAVAVGHEISYRIVKAMDYLRDVKDGKVTPPPVYGYSSTVFGATSAIAMLKRLSGEVHADALGVAGSILPANASHAWAMHAPATTIKYRMAGLLVQAALTAVYSASSAIAGHARSSTTGSTASRATSEPRGGSRTESPTRSGRNGGSRPSSPSSPIPIAESCMRCSTA